MTADDRRPVPPPSLHPDLDTLADLHAGVLDGSTAERVRRHVAGCARCAGTLAGLDAVGASLHALPSPPMPAAVAARLDATLTALRHGDLPRPTPLDHAGPPAPLDGARRPLGGTTARAGGPRPLDGSGPADGRRPEALGPGDTRPQPAGPGDTRRQPAGPGGGRAHGAGRLGQPVTARSTGAPERVADLIAARDRRQRRRSRVLGAAAAALAVLAGTASVTAIVRAGTNSGDDNAASGAGAVADSAEQAPTALPDLPVPSAGPGLSIPSYDRNTLRNDLPGLYRQSAASIITGTTTDDTGPAGAMSSQARRTACANTIRGSSGRVLGVLRITYEGRPAYVFVFGEGTRRTTYVVSDDCGRSPALPASVLDTVS